MKTTTKSKNIFKILVLLFLLFPLMVNANIMCNDGTESPSCQSCHQGCCSWHGGCARNTDENEFVDSAEEEEVDLEDYINEDSEEKEEEIIDIKNKNTKIGYLSISASTMIFSIFAYIGSLIGSMGGKK